jgi:hypothetical protein
MDLDGITLSPSTGASFDGLLIGLIGSSLSVRWATRFGDATGDDSAVGADGYPGGGFVITGYFRGSAYFGGQTFTSAGDTDAFILRVMPSGAHVWSDSFGGVTGDVGGGIATDLLGNFVLTGYFASSIDLGGPPLVGTNDVFVGRFGSGALPSHEWSVALGGADTEIGNDIALDAAGSVCVVGNFNGITDLGGTELTSMGTDGIAIGLVR